MINIFKQGKVFANSFKIVNTPKFNFSLVTPEGEEPEPNFLQMAHIYFDEAAKFTGIAQDKISYYKSTDCVVKFTIPLVRDDGTIDSLTAYRAQHKLYKLPVKGGTRYAPSINL